MRGLRLLLVVSAGGSHTCGITSSGSVECWGWDDDGQVSGAP
ncbi:MAG: RCC1 domain-containing protein [Myxococcota bacterium]|nr:RCC1 domain-containing protein [Myxococcota bacterium]